MLGVSIAVAGRRPLFATRHCSVAIPNLEQTPAARWVAIATRLRAQQGLRFQCQPRRQLQSRVPIKWQLQLHLQSATATFIRNIVSYYCMLYIPYIMYMIMIYIIYTIHNICYTLCALYMITYSIICITHYYYHIIICITCILGISLLLYPPGCRVAGWALGGKQGRPPLFWGWETHKKKTCFRSELDGY